MTVTKISRGGGYRRRLMLMDDDEVWVYNPIGENILDLSQRVEDVYIGQNDNTVPLLSWKGCSASTLIKVNPGEQYHFHSTAKDGGNGWGLYAKYAKNQTWIGNVNGKLYNTKDEVITIPNDTYWIQIALAYVSEIQAGAIITLIRTA